MDGLPAIQDPETLKLIQAQYQSLLKENETIQPLVAAYHEAVASDITRAEQAELDRAAKSKRIHRTLSTTESVSRSSKFDNRSATDCSPDCSSDCVLM